MLRVRFAEVSGPVLATQGTYSQDAYVGLVLDGFEVRIATGPGGRAVVVAGDKTFTMEQNTFLATRAGSSRPLVRPLVGKLWLKIENLLLSPEAQLKRELAEMQGTNAAVGVRG